MRYESLTMLVHFQEPFSWINTTNYPLQTLIRHFRDSEVNGLENFPSNIRQLYFAQPGEPGRQTWLLLGRLDNGLFFFFTAMCLEEGFEEFGSITIRATYDWPSMLTFGIDPEYHMYYDDFQMYYT